MRVRGVCSTNEIAAPDRALGVLGDVRRSTTDRDGAPMRAAAGRCAAKRHSGCQWSLLDVTWHLLTAGEEIFTDLGAGTTSPSVTTRNARPAASPRQLPRVGYASSSPTAA